MSLPPPIPLSKSARFLVVMVIYTAITAVALVTAYLLRFDFVIPADEPARLLLLWPWILAVKLACLFAWGQFRSMMTFFSRPDLERIWLSASCAAAVLLAVWFASAGSYAPPRGVIVTDLVLFGGLLCVFRFSLRIWREHRNPPDQEIPSKTDPVAIIGAGDTGAQLAAQLLSRSSYGLEPVVFLDDDRKKWGARIHGIPVQGSPAWLLSPAAPKTLKRAIMAMPSASPQRVKAIIEQLEGHGLQLETVPSLDELLQGKCTVSKIRPICIDDLLGREAAQLDMANIRQMLRGKVVAVTGAGGSIGSELCRQVASFHPKRLLLIEQCEAQLFQIEQELIEAGHHACIVPLVADICDEERMVEIFAGHHPAVVFHAAAHKHVPMMESQPGEAIKNNALGTAGLVRLAHEHHVGHFIFISTDKAINPTNVMGASKRMAEMYLQAFQARHREGTRFMAVRFGNVLGSSGSVVPIFQKQIAQGGPVRVTHPDITRYFMTIPEAVGLVLQTATLGHGGEIFLLDMGQPVKIVELARQMIRLQGLRPDVDIAIEFTGLRPGEKMFEELNYDSESSARTAHPKIFQVTSDAVELAAVRRAMADLAEQIATASADELKRGMMKLVPEYQARLSAAPKPRPHMAEPAQVTALGLQSATAV